MNDTKEDQKFLDHEFVEVFNDYVNEEVESLRREEKLNLKPKGGEKV